MNVYHIQRLKFTGPLALAIGALPFSVVLCHVGLIILGIVWMAEGKWKEKWESILRNPIVFIFLFFFLLHLLGLMYSEDKPTAWFNIEKKLSLLALPIILASIKLEKEDVRKLFHVFIITCLAATFICLWVAFRKAYYNSPTVNFDSYSNYSFYSLNSKAATLWMYISYIELASGIGIHPVYLSLYLSFCALLVFHFYSASFASFSQIKKIALLILIFYLSTFILFLSARIIIFAYLIISLYGLRQFLKSASPLLYWSTSSIYILFFLGILYLNPVSRFRGYQEIVTTYPYLKPGLQTQSTTIRASLWSMSIKALPKTNLLLGSGTGDVEHLISETSSGTNITNVLGTNDPHNQYLHTLLGIGLLGLFTMMACFALPAWVSFQSGNFLYLGFLFLFSILCITESAMELQKGIVFYAMFSSLLLFQYSPVPESSLNQEKM